MTARRLQGSMDSKQSARERTSARRAAERAATVAAARRRRLVGTGVALAAVLAVLGVTILLVTARDSSSGGAAAVPATAVAGGSAFEVGHADAPVVVTVYEDFLCPACGRFEATVGPVLDQLVDEGRVRVHYAPLAILDRASPDRYPTRAASAAAVVADEAGSGAFRTFHAALFAAQPVEGESGLDDDELVRLAARAGAGGAAVEAGIRDLKYGDWVADVTERAGARGVISTPTVLVDGELLVDRTAAGLRSAVGGAGQDAGMQRADVGPDRHLFGRTTGWRRRTGPSAGGGPAPVAGAGGGGR